MEKENKALPSSGSISASQVNAELKKASNAAMGLNDSDVRKLAGKTSGTISYSDLRGKSNSNKIKIGTYRSSYDNAIMYWGYYLNQYGEIGNRALSNFHGLNLKGLEVQRGQQGQAVDVTISLDGGFSFNTEVRIKFNGTEVKCRPYNEAQAAEGFIQGIPGKAQVFGNLQFILDEFKRLSENGVFYDIEIEFYNY
ncbi:MAG: hypothetical protein ACRCZ9_05100 [Fusobacteriaceae bacterium]